MERWIPPQEWFDSLEGESKEKAERLITLLEKFGASDPVAWISSEMRENIPQVARFLFLHEVRSRLIDDFTFRKNFVERQHKTPLQISDDGEEAYNRLIESGVSVNDLELIAHAAAAESVGSFIDLLDGVLESELDRIDDAPRWKLAELSGPIEDAKPTGRYLNGLHESFNDIYSRDG